ncbi:recombinase family protein [Flavihumibacter profundi]|uniref:recombinase family protein n=1 Tax=Flavihumibacter profundi TaxID=2716883 RepID=UPI001CC38F26|nr:recombinase family protein [Flavihumibacter profundi]MBZ5859447.1 recombinase family protein [Flavihumibacter profundi]
MKETFVAYYRVSTGKQEYGVEAQRHSVKTFLVNYTGCNDGNCIEKEFIEIESGRNNDRLVLSEALEYCKKNKSTLIVSKLDRLSRDVAFLFKTIKESGVNCRVVDIPDIKDTLTLGIFAAFAQFEAERISKRTKEALAARKARGLGKRVVNNLTPERIKAGNDARRDKARTQRSTVQVMDLIKFMRKEDKSYREIAGKLMERGFETSTGKKDWTAIQVQRIDKRFTN